MSTYFHIDPGDVPWPPIFEKVYLRHQYTILEDGTCLGEAVLTEDEISLLIEAGGVIIGDINDIHEWISNNRDLFPEQEEI